MSRLDVVALGNPPRRRAVARVLRLRRRARARRGLDDPGRHGAADEIYAAMGPGTEISGGSAANTAGRRRRLRWQGRVRRPHRRRHVRQGVRPRPASPRGVEFDVSPATDGGADRSLPRDRRRGRGAHDAHLPRAPARARSARRQRRADRRRGGHLPRGLPLGRAGGQRCHPAAARLVGEAGRKVRALALRPVLRRPASGRVPRAGRRSVDILFAQRVRDHDALRGRRLRRRGAATSPPTARSRRSPGRARVRSWWAQASVTSSPPTRSTPWTTPRAPATSTRPGSSTGSPTGHDLRTCGRLGSLGAAEVISHLGARPEISLADPARRLLGMTSARRWRGCPATAPAMRTSTSGWPTSSPSSATCTTATWCSSSWSGGAPRHAITSTGRSQDGERRAQGDALRLQRVRALPVGAQGGDLRFGAHAARDDPLYAQTRSPRRELAAVDWMVITGAGPGIMEAGIEGAGAANSFGVSIRLPFEAATTSSSPTTRSS